MTVEEATIAVMTVRFTFSVEFSNDTLNLTFGTGYDDRRGYDRDPYRERERESYARPMRDDYARSSRDDRGDYGSRSSRY